MSLRIVPPRSSLLRADRFRPERVGRYVIFGELASGGSASVHLGRQLGPVGFSRIVAIKRPHAQVQRDPELLAMFVDEARMTARVNHPNAVTTLDVVLSGQEMFLVLEYVHGESLSRILRSLAERRERVPPRVAVAIVAGALHGLHAIHEAKDERGEPLGIVHRDVSPHNILVGADGGARILDLGIAKAAGRATHTRDGILKGKLAYMAPERLNGEAATVRGDIYAAAVVLWEALTGERLVQADDEVGILAKALAGDFETAGQRVADLPAGIDAVVTRGLSRDPSQRFESAREMALALEAAGVSSQEQVAEWVGEAARDVFRARAAMVAEAETIQPSTSGMWKASRGVVESPERDDGATLTASSSQERASLTSSVPDAPTTTRRVILVHPASGRTLPLSRVRSTLMCSGIATLRERGHFDEYTRLRGHVQTFVPGVWLSVSTAMAHFKACEGLGLSPDEAFAVGAASGNRMQANFVKTLTSLIAGAGATPWSVLGLYSRLWVRNFDGGSVFVTRVGDRAAEIGLRGLPFAGFSYFRDAFRGANHAGIVPLAPTLQVREIACYTTSTSFVLGLTW